MTVESNCCHIRNSMHEYYFVYTVQTKTTIIIMQRTVTMPVNLSWVRGTLHCINSAVQHLLIMPGETPDTENAAH